MKEVLLKGRVITTSILFAVMHGNNIFSPCVPWQIGAGQIVACLLNCNLSILYESGGITSTASSHILNNMAPLIPMLLNRLFL